MIFPLALVGLVLILVLATSSWRAHRQLMQRLRSEWGRPRKRERDMEGIADFFRLREDDGAAVDDRTWNDLLLDDVFAVLDRTESTVGQQILYDRLRGARGDLDEFESLVAQMGADAHGRKKAQVALAGVHEPSGYYLHRLARPDTIERAKWEILYPLWTATVLGIVFMGLFRPRFLLVLVFAFFVNLAIRTATADRIRREAAWFRQVGPLLSAARGLARLGFGATPKITGSLKGDLDALRWLGQIARWVSRDPATTNDIVFSILEYLNIFLLMDVNALYFASHELKLRAPHLIRVIQTVGEIDAAIAVASFRAGSVRWVRPRFAEPHAPVTFAGLCHPLLENAVPNSLALVPPHGLLVTGSNMSGKSTLLRTVGINVVLAQTIHTCLAQAYEAPVYQVRSCIGRADDLIAGKSYYLVEVESVLALVRASESSAPHLFIFDELFRGTNAVERIAAAEAVLEELIGRGKPHVTLAATHDGELVDLLSDSYAVCHFEDHLGPSGLTFNYRLVQGPATSRNAIALLTLNGAPKHVVDRALARAAELDRLRQGRLV